MSSDAGTDTEIAVEAQEGSVSRGLALGLVNNLTMRVGSVLLGVLLARLLAPEAFGLFAVALTVQAILANLTDLGMTAYLVRVDDPERKAGTVLAIGLALGGFLTLVMVAFATPIARVMGSAAAAPAVRVLALTLLLSGIGSVPTALIQRRLQQGKQLIADGSSFVVNAVVVIPLILAGMGALSLAWSRVVGQLVAVVLLFVFAGWFPRVRLDRKIAAEASRFGLPMVGANVLSWALLNVDYVVVGRHFGPVLLGVYVLAFNIASWPSSALSQALRAVALPAFARSQHDENGTRTRTLGIALALSLAVGGAIGAMLAALSAPVVHAVYGETWARAAAPLAALAAFGAVRPGFDLLATYLTARNRPQAVLWIQVLWGVALVPALIIGVHLWGIAGAGLAHLISGMLVVAPAYLYALHRDGVHVRALLGRLAQPVLATVLAALAAWAVSRAGLPAWPTVLLGGIAAGVVLLAALGRWGRANIAELRGAPPARERPEARHRADPLTPGLIAGASPRAAVGRHVSPGPERVRDVRRPVRPEPVAGRHASMLSEPAWPGAEMPAGGRS